MINLLKKDKLKIFNDKRGSLFFFQNNNSKIERVFFIKGKKGMSRGNHAHKKTRQILININAKAKISIIREKEKKISFSKKGDLVNLPELTWIKINFLNDGFIAVVCDKKYLKYDYINDFKKFKKLHLK